MDVEANMSGPQVSTWGLWQWLRHAYLEHEFTFGFGSDAREAMRVWEPGEGLERDSPMLVIPRQKEGGVASSLVKGLIRKELPIDNEVPLQVQALIQQKGWHQA